MILLSGCSVDYNLDIKNDKFIEKVNININPQDKENGDVDLNVDSQLMGNRLKALIDYDVFSFFQNYSSVYDKKLIQEDGYEILELNYTYSDSNINNSNVINTCFENREVLKLENGYKISLSGYFYCLYNNEQITININTKDKVVSSNAINRSDNKLTWVINKNNFENVKIDLEIEKNNDSEIIEDGYLTGNIIKYILIGLGIIILIGVVIIYGKVKKSNK